MILQTTIYGFLSQEEIFPYQKEAPILTHEIRKEDMRIIKSMDERARNLEQFKSVQADLSAVIEPTRKFIGKPTSSNEKSRLITLGTSIMLIPEPTPVTPIIGGTMVAAGLLESRLVKKPLSICDTKREFGESLKEMQKLRQTFREYARL